MRPSAWNYLWSAPALIALASPFVAYGVAPAESLDRRLAAIARRCDGRLGVSVLHVESGREHSIGAGVKLPLYSVFKLPLAVLVLEQVERGALSLEQAVTVARDDVSPGLQSNTERWRDTPQQVDVERLLELSLVESDNTASDKLLELVGGPEQLTASLRALGIRGIEGKASTKQLNHLRRHPNRGSARALTQMLAALQRGQLLAPAQVELLKGWLRSSRIGAHRLRGALPPQIDVVAKTGTGRDGAATNDVGLVTLPEGRGQLAIAVLLSGSKLPHQDQEQVLAEIGRAAFDAYTSR